jgi:C1A family cysteine protease
MAPARRIHGLRPDIDDPRDKHFRTDYLKMGKLRQRFKAALLPSSVDLRNEPSPGVYDQGAIGSCVDNALATLLGHLTNDQGQGVAEFSRLFMYGNARGWVEEDTGSSLRDAVKGVDKFGVPLEVLWPYDVQMWTTKPPQPVWDAARHRHQIEYYRLDTLQGMKITLSEGVPFIFGIGVYDTFTAQAPDYTVPLPKNWNIPQGGHALCAMGYDDKRGAFLFRNSWGDDWGDKGHAWLPYEYVATGDWMDAWTVRKISD